MMVNFIIVSEYSGGPAPGDRVKIGGDPLYSLERVQGLVSKAGSLFLWTTKCRRDVPNLGWDEDDVADLIRSLNPSDYKDSEWCDNGRVLGPRATPISSGAASGSKQPAKR